MNQLEFINVSNIEKGQKLKETIYYVPRSSSFIIGIISIGLLIPNHMVLRILGAVLLLFDLVIFWFTKQWVVAQIYTDCMVLYHDQDRTKAIRIDYDTISEWSTYEPQNNIGTLFITFQDASTFTYNHYQMGAIKGVLNSLIRDKHTFQKKMDEFKSSKKTASSFFNLFKRKRF